jgi:hypothetical protein
MIWKYNNNSNNRVQLSSNDIILMIMFLAYVNHLFVYVFIYSLPKKAESQVQSHTDTKRREHVNENDHSKTSGRRQVRIKGQERKKTNKARVR